MAIYCTLLSIMLWSVTEVHSHGRLLDPPMRASVWRFPEFEHLNPPVNYDDDAFWCGSMSTLYSQNGGKWGVRGQLGGPETKKHGGRREVRARDHCQELHQGTGNNRLLKMLEKYER
ncbi:hypothetical protein Ocin01_07356 [Orchesella cincta]|uniref:Uncharacterized protein n=1 Tax=Orchesella cincta TaxID=48709 RepID=A0A1D2N263_ORCCI|nr:hypothetical protein Ocin01_07356 [Orchesella cincta]